MSKDQDQTQTEEIQDDDQDTATATAVEYEPVSTDKAVKTSEKFDEMLDNEGVEDETIADDDTTGDKDKDTADKATKDDGDDKDSAGDKEADKTAGSDDTEGINLSEALIQRAADYGLTPEEIAEHTDDASLERTLKILDNIIADDDGQDGTTQTSAAADNKTDEDEFHMKFEKEEEIDPELLKGIRAMEKHFSETVKGLREKLEGVTGNLQQQAQTEFLSRFDKKIEALGTDFADVFGQGPSSQFSSRSAAGRNRNAVRTRMYAFAKGLADAGEKIPDEDALFEMAVSSLHGTKMRTIAGKQMHDKTKQRAAQARVGRASTRRAGNLTPKQKAVETSRKFDELIDTSET